MAAITKTVKKRKSKTEGSIAKLSLSGTARSDGDRRWDEAFARTTPEQLARLERIFVEDDEDTPLDFTDK